MLKYLAERLIKYGFVPAVYCLIRIHLRTLRLTVVGEEALIAHLSNGGKGIVGIWHQRLFGLLQYAPRFGPYAPSAIISQSRDGDLLAQTLKMCGIRPIRGSSSRGGEAALKAMLCDLKTNSLAGHALDGPQGPPWVVKPGLIAIAQRAQASIFPLYVAVDRAWTLRSWDRMLIPKPFSRLLVYWGAPVLVPEQLNEAQFEAAREDIEKLMTSRQQELDRRWREKREIL